MTHTGKPGRPRDESLAARRQEEILDAATTLFAVRGYRGTDVQLVADKLQIGKGTVYRYFPSKRALFLAAVNRGLTRLTATVDTAVAQRSDPIDGMVEAIAAYLRFFQRNAELVELFVQERAEFGGRQALSYFTHRDAQRPRWRAMARALIRSGRIRHVPVERILDVVDNLLYGTMFSNHFTGRRPSYAQQARDIAEILLEGIISPQERTRRRNRSARSAPPTPKGKAP